MEGLVSSDQNYKQACTRTGTKMLQAEMVQIELVLNPEHSMVWSMLVNHMEHSLCMDIKCVTCLYEVISERC